MCGIFGIYQPPGERAEVEASLLKGLAQLDHRGPDAWGSYISNELALGHTRLSIVDLAEGHQPMVSDDTVLSFNGEIYNHLELRRELEREGVVFRTHSDTEVLQRMYEHYGLKAFSRFNGQFAFLLWDKRNRCLVVARDRLGIRPLYVWQRGRAIYFSSEMKAFDALFPGERELEPGHLYEHALLWNTLGRDTVYRDIASVSSGTAEIYRGGARESIYRYYDIGNGPSLTSTPSFEEARDEFHAHLDRAVSLRLRSDVPVGGYLSGGIDSTAICQLSKQHKHDRLSTFSIAFDDSRFDESAYQDIANDSIRSDMHKVAIGDDSISERFMEVMYHGERPIFRMAPAPMFALSEAVRESDIRVVLTGEGADEILFGYDSFKELKLLERWKQSGDAAAAGRDIAGLYPHLQHYADNRQLGLMRMYYESFLDSFDNDLVGLNIRIHNNKVIANYLNPDWRLPSDAQLHDKLISTLPANFSDWTLLQKNSYLEIKTLLQGYLLSSQGDRMSLGHSIEGRYPFLDHELIDYVFHLPDDYKLNGTNQKYILKQALAASLPQAISARPKQPYMAPDIYAFYNEKGIKEVAESLLSPQSIDETGAFNGKMVTRFLRKFSKGVPAKLGYRDNMIFTFILSTQACLHWIKHPRINVLDPAKRSVNVNDYDAVMTQ